MKILPSQLQQLIQEVIDEESMNEGHWKKLEPAYIELKNLMDEYDLGVDDLEDLIGMLKLDRGEPSEEDGYDYEEEDFLSTASPEEVIARYSKNIKEAHNKWDHPAIKDEYTALGDWQYQENIERMIKEELEEIRAYDRMGQAKAAAGVVGGAALGGLLGFFVGGVGAIPGAIGGGEVGRRVAKSWDEKKQQQILRKLGKQIATEQSLMDALGKLNPPDPAAWLEERLEETELTPEQISQLRFDERDLRAAAAEKLDPKQTDKIITILAKKGILDLDTISVKIRKGIEALSDLPGMAAGAFKDLGDDEKYFGEVTQRRLDRMIKEELAKLSK